MALKTISFVGLAPEKLLEAAEIEIQSQLHHTGGELFLYRKPKFKGYNLLRPSAEVQGLLQYFASIGCVCSEYRLAYSLLPNNVDEWPLKSEDLAYYYAFSAAEARINLEYDERVSDLFEAFEYSSEFARYRYMMNDFIRKYAESRSISTDIIWHFQYLSKHDDKDQEFSEDMTLDS
ncbi:hypothetical protein DFO83_102119 [Idiomarina loihiensis]|uniref:hypothetical protein n=1 Tax=Idiomarina TaxID=135575 RepID=UPI000D716B5F|nr:hypothetical protein [Idiomarina]PWW40301.1 hypothetical protein DFO83_102119 [Idiomarina loihiensis]TDP49992.1 hypothetical protein DET58_102115 [Idiomarina loihiensis]TDS24656.1 hypothetical protein DET62_102265 [Idiomarina sp. H2]